MNKIEIIRYPFNNGGEVVRIMALRQLFRTEEETLQALYNTANEQAANLNVGYNRYIEDGNPFCVVLVYGW